MAPVVDPRGRPLRSVLYIPGSKERALEKARDLAADAIIFDLEDAVAAEEKENARAMLAQALAAGGYGSRLKIVRINGFDTRWGRDDAAAFARAAADAILVPKVGTPADLDAVAALVPDLPLWAMMETPAGILNAAAIALHPRLQGMVMGTNDLEEGAEPAELRIELTDEVGSVERDGMWIQQSSGPELELGDLAGLPPLFRGAGAEGSMGQLQHAVPPMGGLLGRPRTGIGEHQGEQLIEDGLPALNLLLLLSRAPRDELALARQNLPARYRRSRDQHQESDSRILGRQQRSDQASFAMPEEADPVTRQIFTLAKEVESGPRVLGEVQGGRADEAALAFPHPPIIDPQHRDPLAGEMVREYGEGTMLEDLAIPVLGSRAGDQQHGSDGLSVPWKSQGPGQRSCRPGVADLLAAVQEGRSGVLRTVRGRLHLPAQLERKRRPTLTKGTLQLPPFEPAVEGRRSRDAGNAKADLRAVHDDRFQSQPHGSLEGDVDGTRPGALRRSQVHLDAQRGSRHLDGPLPMTGDLRSLVSGHTKHQGETEKGTEDEMHAVSESAQGRTSTPFQNATCPEISAAASLGSG